ncbi:MAG: glycosyltransferase family 2 protein [Azonexus sp.]
MATYNGASYLREQLDSFTHQTRRPDELVVCDDGSSDETVAIVENFSREAPFEVRISRNDSNLGYARNFERAIGLCSGDIVFLSDQDDVWFPEKLQRVESWFAEHPQTLLFMNDAEFVLADGERTGLTKLEQIRSLGLGDDYFVLGCCMAIRASGLPLLMPLPDDLFSHDGWLSKMTLLLEAKMIFPVVLQYFRRHQTNTSASISSSTRKLNRLDLLKDFRGRDSRQPCLERLACLDMAESRLQRLGAPVLESIGLGRALTVGLGNIAAERAAVEARVRVLGMAPWRRVGPALLLWRRGQYRFFSGWKSFIKDLIKT